MSDESERSAAASREFTRLWSESLSRVLGKIGRITFSPGRPEIQRAPESGSDAYITATLSGSVRGELAFRLSQEHALALVQIFAQEELTPGTELTAERRSALEELFRQIAGDFSISAKSLLPAVSVTITAGGNPTWPSAASGWYDTGEDAPHSLSIEWRLSAALNAALASLPPEPGVAPAAGANTEASGAMEFFMDLKLDVTLRFGGKEILLKDVLDLGPGSVLELDREIDDPADLLLDGKLIARGEVLTVDGYFGLRVTELLTGAAGAH